MADFMIQQGMQSAMQQVQQSGQVQGQSPTDTPGKSQGLSQDTPNTLVDNVERFQNAMKAQNESPNVDTMHHNAQQQADAVHISSPAQAVDGTPPIKKVAGDNVLDALQRDMSNARTGIEESLQSMQGSTGDMLRLQYQMAQVTMTQSLVGQVGSKTGQGVQQLLKGQG